MKTRGQRSTSCRRSNSRLIVSGCATFHLTQEPLQPKGKKLKVISGLTNASSWAWH